MADPDPDRLRRALAAIDAANADDPHRIELSGRSGPKELLHAELVSGWIERLRPDPDEALRLAARAHHVRRWEIPRDRYPEGRAGYHRWRRALQEHHAEIAAGILAREGYDAGSIARVRQILRKRGLGCDPDVQAFEDALCLAFLETQLRGMAERHPEEKLLDILRKTLRRMSPRAVELAGELALDPRDRALLARAGSARDEPASLL